LRIKVLSGVVILKTRAETPPLKDSMAGLGSEILWVEIR